MDILSISNQSSPLSIPTSKIDSNLTSNSTSSSRSSIATTQVTSDSSIITTTAISFSTDNHININNTLFTLNLLKSSIEISLKNKNSTKNSTSELDPDKAIDQEDEEDEDEDEEDLKILRKLNTDDKDKNKAKPVTLNKNVTTYFLATSASNWVQLEREDDYDFVESALIMLLLLTGVIFTSVVVFISSRLAIKLVHRRNYNNIEMSNLRGFYDWRNLKRQNKHESVLLLL